MEEEKVNNRKKIILISSITIVALILVVGISYALWQQSKVQEGTNYIASGCFGVQFEGNNPINLANSFPITTEDGMKTTPYTFTITNTCNGKAAYDVNLESLSNTTFQNSSIRVALDDTNKLYSEYTEAEKYYDTSIESRKLISGRLEANESVTYNLRIWIDEAVTIEEQNKTFASKIVVNASEDFDEPEITDINATSTINSISITYQANGDISNTCKWGIEEGTYDNEVVDATNTNCDITGLSDNTTYYYQICTETGKGNKCETGNIRTKYALANHVEIGDYIKMTPTSTSYTIKKELTGYTSDQTIKPSELNLWRVIKKTEDGTIEMVSDMVSSNLVYLKGDIGYRNLIGVLNEIAQQYTDGVHVRDTRHMGYGGHFSADRYCSDYLSCPEDMGYITDIRLVSSVYSEETCETYNCDGLKATRKNYPSSKTGYWLASRAADLDREPKLFYGRTVYYDMESSLWSISVNCLLDAHWNFYEERGSIRPIVELTLSSSIKSGLGTSSSPYILQ